MDAQQEEQVASRTVAGMKEAVTSGRLIVIYGWLGSSHDTFTRSLDERHIRFEEKVPRTLPSKAGFIVATGLAGGCQKQLRGSGLPCCSTVLTPSRIKRLLKEVGPAILKPKLSREDKRMTAPSQAKSAPNPTMPASGPTYTPGMKAVDIPPTSDPSDAPAPNPEPTPARTREERERDFAVEFMQAVGGDAQKTLSKYEASALLKKHFDGVAVNPSSQKKLLGPVVSDGKSRAGNYRATQELIKLAGMTPQVEPTDPVERARWLAEREPQWEAEKAELEHQRELISEKFDQRRAELLASLEREKGMELTALGGKIADVDELLRRSAKARRWLADGDRL